VKAYDVVLRVHTLQYRVKDSAQIVGISYKGLECRSRG
jgi:hypothetical protein